MGFLSLRRDPKIQKRLQHRLLILDLKRGNGYAPPPKKKGVLLNKYVNTNIFLFFYCPWNFFFSWILTFYIKKYKEKNDQGGQKKYHRPLFGAPDQVGQHLNGVVKLEDRNQIPVVSKIIYNKVYTFSYSTRAQRQISPF